MLERHVAKDAVDAAETTARSRNLVPQPATVENEQFLAELRQFTVDDFAPYTRKNHLLAALSVTDWQRWLPQLKAVEMSKGQVLCESGSLPTHVYFPTTAIVSLLYLMENGASAGTAVVGNEGVVGVSLFMGGGSTPSRAVVQSAGQGFRMKVHAFKSEFNQSPPVLHLLLRYTQALITQMAQTAACNRHHSLDKQLCRWLLLCLDRLPRNEIMMTQESIANMLGVRREGVSEAALKLQESGLIRYVRGHITVLDREGLEKRTCECYATVKQEYDRLLPCVGGGAIRSLAAGQSDVCTRTVGNAWTPRASVPGSAAVVVRSVIQSGRFPCFSTPLSFSLSP